MSTLLIRLAAPLQSWGTGSRFSVRLTELDPSFSGVLGLVAAAQGRPRSASLADLTKLRMGVRVDREGSRIVDYHTANLGGDVALTWRHYLADAQFLVGLEGDEKSLTAILSALRRPIWPPYLGRRACPPSPPVHLPDGGIRKSSLEDALRHEPWHARWEGERPPERLRLVLPGTDGLSTRMDVPVSHTEGRWSYTQRPVREAWIPVPLGAA